MKSATDIAMTELHKARRRLQSDQGRVARRNARRAVWGAMKALRNAINAEYPMPEKHAPEPVTPARIADYSVDFQRPWDIDVARLFVAAASQILGTPMMKVLAHEGAKFMTGYSTWSANPAGIITAESGGKIWFGTSWVDRKKWQHVAENIRLAPRNTPVGPIVAPIFREEIDALWNSFWSEPIAFTDLEDAARHQELLDKLARKRKVVTA
jgi:hypothetical protein